MSLENANGIVEIISAKYTGLPRANRQGAKFKTHLNASLQLPEVTSLRPVYARSHDIL